MASNEKHDEVDFGVSLCTTSKSDIECDQTTDHHTQIKIQISSDEGVKPKHKDDSLSKTFAITGDRALEIAVNKVNCKCKKREGETLDFRQIKRSPIFQRKRGFQCRRAPICEQDSREREVLKQTLKAKLRGDMLEHTIQ